MGKKIATAFILGTLAFGGTALTAATAQAAGPVLQPKVMSIQPKHAHPGTVAACKICKQNGVWAGNKK